MAWGPDDVFCRANLWTCTAARLFFAAVEIEGVAHEDSARGWWIQMRKRAAVTMPAIAVQPKIRARRLRPPPPCRAAACRLQSLLGSCLSSGRTNACLLSPPAFPTKFPFFRSALALCCTIMRGGTLSYRIVRRSAATPLSQ